VTLSDLRNQVRTIHLLKEKTLPIYHHYFHRDLEGYLAKATIHSLQTYIDHYLPAIEFSIQQSEDINNGHSQFDIGSIITVSANDVATPNTLPTTPENPPPHTLHDSLEEPSHRKRKRRKILSRLARAIREWTRTKFHHPAKP
jgi:hypothetical protein